LLHVCPPRALPLVYSGKTQSTIYFEKKSICSGTSSGYSCLSLCPKQCGACNCGGCFCKILWMITNEFSITICKAKFSSCVSQLRDPQAIEFFPPAGSILIYKAAASLSSRLPPRQTKFFQSRSISIQKVT